MDPVTKDSMVSSLSSSTESSTVSSPQSTKSQLIATYAPLAWYTVSALGIALFIRFFIAAPYIVEGASMEPTFHTYDYLVIDKLSYEVGEPVRGDVIVMLFPYDTTRSFIKRVIGLPGDTVILEGQNVTIQNAEYLKGYTLPEPYIAPENVSNTHSTVVLGPNQYFVLGDNRKASADSRSWGILPRSDIVGRALVRLYPLNLIGINPGEARYTFDTSAANTALTK